MHARMHGCIRQDGSCQLCQHRQCAEVWTLHGQVVLSMLQEGCSLPLRLTAVKAIAGLARSPFNRYCLVAAHNAAES